MFHGFGAETPDKPARLGAGIAARTMNCADCWTSATISATAFSHSVVSPSDELKRRMPSGGMTLSSPDFGTGSRCPARGWRSSR
jgi:hypothetical protein